MHNQHPDDRYVRIAVMILLFLVMLSSMTATLIHWLSPVHHWMDLVVPPTVTVLMAGLIVALVRQPQQATLIAHITLVIGALALIAPAWFYSLQAITTPGIRLIDTLPPVSSLFVVLVVMVMIFLPLRQAIAMSLACWVLIALPVLVYLVSHPAQIATPRGMELLMAYGPVVIIVAAVLPIQNGLSGSIRSLTTERAYMQSMMHRDPLTGIFNRRLGEHMLSDLIDEGVPTGVIMFDVDRFKAINDTHGHPIGDRVLTLVTDRCRQFLRGDQSIARWGGEEFMVILPDINSVRLQHMSDLLQKAIADLRVAPVSQVTASFGAVMSTGSDSLANVLERVDRALYLAKEQGGNRVVMTD